jgi:glycosyltransferase involved in cell wall biosynthesis
MSNVLVSIGMPIRNCEKTLSKAIEAILNQNYKNLELIISDNASTDKTREICEKYQLLDSRILYFRHDFNIGPTKNFAYTLKESNGKYFAWAAGDDVKDINFIDVNLDILENNEKAIASMGAIRIERAGVLGDVIKVGEFKGSPVDKFKKYFKTCNYSQGLIYSLMIREEISQCEFIEELFFGWDWAINLFLLKKGDILFSNETCTTFSAGGISNSKDVYKFHGIYGFRRVFPFMKFNGKVWHLTASLSTSDRLEVVRELIFLNSKSLILEIRSIYPFLGKVKRGLKRLMRIKV